MAGWADLHVHSTASDGTWTPAEVVQRAAQRGVTTLALTDHDTTAGLAAAQPVSLACGVRLIPAVEVTADVQGQIGHLLAYWIDPQDPYLQALLRTRQEARRARVEEILARLSAVTGIDLAWAEIEQAARGAPSLGRPHVAQALAAQGDVSSPRKRSDSFYARAVRPTCPIRPTPRPRRCGPCARRRPGPFWPIRAWGAASDSCANWWTQGWWAWRSTIRRTGPGWSNGFGGKRVATI